MKNSKLLTIDEYQAVKSLIIDDALLLPGLPSLIKRGLIKRDPFYKAVSDDFRKANPKSLLPDLLKGVHQ